MSTALPLLDHCGVFGTPQLQKDYLVARASTGLACAAMTACSTASQSE